MKDTLTKYYELQQLKKQLIELNNEKQELLIAEDLLKKNKNRKIYRTIGNMLIEVTLDEAIKYIRERIEVIELLIKKISNEIKKIKNLEQKT